MNRKIYNLVCAALCLALCIVLPFLTGQIPEIGSAAVAHAPPGIHLRIGLRMGIFGLAVDV